MAGQPRKRAKQVAEQLAAEQTPETEQPTAPPADRPPRQRKRGTASSAPRPATAPAAAPPPEANDRRPVGIRKIHDGLVELFTLLGLGASMFADPFSGQVVALNAERLARAWSDLAAQNATVRRALEALLQGSAWGAAIGSTAMVAVPILVRYQVAPPDLMAVAAAQGVKLPDYGQATEPAADRPPAPASFTPESPAEPPHPFDSGVGPEGPSVNGATPDQAPAFPHNPPA